LTLIIVLAFATPGWAPPSRPEINVQGNDGQVPPTWTDIPHQDVTPTTAKGTDFGNAFFGVNVDHTFKIQNTGTADLTLDGTPPDYVVIGGTNPADFTVTLQPTTPVAQSGETTFTIRFNTSTEGLRQATVTIPNNDNNEDPYTFTIQGTGVAGAPEINVTGNGQTILSGDINPELADGTLFLDTGVGSTRDQDFVIQNTGDADLDLTGAPLVEITGINPGDFTVTLQPSTPVGAGLSETFTVQFNPQAGGLRTATVNIANNDTTGGESVYTFDIEGTGTVAAPTVTIGTPSVANVEDTTATLRGNITSTGGEAPGQGTKVSETPGPYVAGQYGIPVTFSAPDVGKKLYFQAFASNPTAGAGYSAEQAFQTEPSQVSGVSIISVTYNSFEITWTYADATADGAIVVVKQGVAVDTGPTDFILPNAVSNPWNGGDELGTANYVVYRGTGTSVTIYGLASNTTYHVAIYAYAGSGVTDPDGINYQQDGPQRASDTTPSGPPSLSNPSTIGFAAENSATLEVTIDTDGGTSIAEHGTIWDDTIPVPVLPSNNATTLGSTVPTTFQDSRTALPSGKLIYFVGYATNQSQTGYSPVGTFYTEPDAQASIVSVSNPSFDSLDINWTPPPGRDAYDGSIVVVRRGEAVVDDPVDGNAHAADSVFEAGDELGAGNDTYVVYRGTAISVTVRCRVRVQRFGFENQLSAGSGHGEWGDYKSSQPQGSLRY
jgi:hypothetical protein